jgi:hypothetical protein
MPAAHKKEYHGSFPGGYVDHVNRVVRAAIDLNELWGAFGVDITTYTKEELMFSAINHDLGKMGDSENEAYIPQTDQWRKDKLGEDYMFNKKLPFASVPDRTLFLLQQHDISYSFNEMLKFSQNSVEEPKKQFNLKSKQNSKSKALNTIKSPGLKNMLDSL